LNSADRNGKPHPLCWEFGFMILTPESRTIGSVALAAWGLVSVRQAELANRVTLYKALGGGWQQHTASGG
jgi:hypothetical protein